MPTTIEKTSKSRLKDPTLNRFHNIKNSPLPYIESKNNRLSSSHLNLNSVKTIKTPNTLYGSYIKYSGIIASIGSLIE